MSNLGQFAVSVMADIARFSADMGRAATSMERSFSRSSQQTNRLVGDMTKKLEADARRAERTFSAMRNTVAGAFSAVAVTNFTRSLARTADEYANISARVRLVTTSNQQLKTTQEQIFAISQRTYSSLSSTATLVSRTTQALVSNGASAEVALQKSLRLSETIQQAFAVSGSTNAEASNAIIQLSQGLAAGALRGEEFNSVAEQGPRIMRALADSLGVTTGQLREMAKEGKLTAEVVQTALTQQASEIAAEFEKLPLTISRAFQVFDNSWTKFVGEADQASGASRVIAESIAAVGRNLDTVANIVLGVASVIAVNLGVKALTSIRAFVLAQMESAAAAQKLAVDVQLANAKLEAKARVAAVAAKADQAAALQAMAAAEADVARGRAAELLIRQNALRAKSEIELARLSAQLTAAEASTAAATNSLGAARATLVRANAAAIASERAYQAAVAGTATATAAATAAKGGMLATLGKLGTGMLAFVGGPLGAGILAFGAIALAVKAASDEQTAFTARLIETEKALDDFIRTGMQADLTALFNPETGGNRAAEDIQELTERIARLNEQAEINERRAAGGGRFAAEFAAGARQARGEAERLQVEVDRLSEKTREAGRRFLDAAREMLGFGKSAATIARDISDWYKAQDKAQDSLREQIIELRGGVRALEEYRAMQAAGVDSVNKLSDAQRREMEETIRLKQELKGLQEAKKEAKKATFELSSAYDDCAVALKLLNEEFEANKKAGEDARKEHERQQDQIKELIADMEFEVAVIGMTNDERERAIALRYAEAGATVEQRQRISELITTLQKKREIAAAAEEFESLWVNAANNVGDALTTALFDGAEDGADAIKDVMENLARDLVRFWLQQNIVIPLQQQVMGGAGGGGFNMNSLLSLFGGGGGGGGAGAGSFLSGLGTLFSNSNGAGFMSNLGSLFGFGAGATSAATLGGTTAWGAFGPGSSAWVGLGSSGAAAGAGSAAGAGGLAGAASTMGWVPIVGWIIAAMAANDSMYSQGWRYNGANVRLPNGATVRGGGDVSAFGELMGLGGAVGLADRLFSGIFDDRTASLLSGSAIHTRLWGRRAPVLTNGETRFDFGGDAVSGSQRYRTYEEGGLFRSSRRRWHEFDLGDEARAVGQAMFEALQQEMGRIAQVLRVEVPEQFDAALQVIQEFDKKGNVKLTKYIVEVLGRSFEEATEEAAQLRLAAEAQIATVMQAFSDASEVAERWREDAETLAAGAQFLVGIASDMRNGFDLLGRNALKPIIELLEELTPAGGDLAATYASLVVSTNLLDDALSLMGIDLDRTREQMVRFAHDIAEAAGGIERAQALWSSYFENFFSAQERAQLTLSRATTAGNSEFADIGLQMSDYLRAGGAAAFRQLFEQVVPTLSAEALVQWLEAANALGIVLDLTEQYNDLLADTASATRFNIETASAYAATVQDLQAQLADLSATSDFQREIMAIGRAYRDNVDALHAAARAAGLNEARTEDLAVAYQVAARQAARAIAQLMQAGRQLGGELYGSALGDVEAQIAELEAKANDAQSSLTGFGDAIGDVANAATNAMNLLLGDLSPLKDREKLDLAMQALRRGEIGADQVLQIGRRLFSSGSDYNRLFSEVMSIQNARPANVNTGIGASNPNRVTPEMQALIDQRTRLQGERDQMDRRVRALDLAQMVADVAGATGESFADVLATFTGGRATMQQFADDLGIDITELNDFLEGLQAATYSPFEYADALRVEFDRFLEGLRELLKPPQSVSGETAIDVHVIGTGKPVAPGGVLPGYEISDPLGPYDPLDNTAINNPVEVTPIGERPIEREFIDELKALRGDFVTVVELVAENTGSTAAGIAELVMERRSDTLKNIAAAPRSERLSGVVR